MNLTKHLQDQLIRPVDIATKWVLPTTPGLGTMHYNDANHLSSCLFQAPCKSRTLCMGTEEHKWRIWHEGHFCMRVPTFSGKTQRTASTVGLDTSLLWKLQSIQYAQAPGQRRILLAYTIPPHHRSIPSTACSQSYPRLSYIAPRVLSVAQVGVPFWTSWSWQHCCLLEHHCRGLCHMQSFVAMRQCEQTWDCWASRCLAPKHPHAEQRDGKENIIKT